MAGEETKPQPKPSLESFRDSCIKYSSMNNRISNITPGRRDVELKAQEDLYLEMVKHTGGEIFACDQDKRPDLIEQMRSIANNAKVNTHVLSFDSFIISALLETVKLTNKPQTPPSPPPITH